MWVTVRGKDSTQIDDRVVERVLDLYPEESLRDRKVFGQAFSSGRIRYADLKSECEKLLIPWQLLFLNPTNLQRQIDNIEANRVHKTSRRLLAKRPGAGGVTSKRIIDRLIRLQGYVSGSCGFPKSSYCGSLKGLRVHQAAAAVVSYFEIDQPWLWARSGKGTALEYLIGRVEERQINVSQGVLTNRMLPHHKVVPGAIYKNTSGFVIKDDRVPFVFLPSEINPDEVESRQIFSLIYLLVILGLDEFDYCIEKDFSFSRAPANKVLKRIYAIATEILIPNRETELLRGTPITIGRRNELSDKFKVSPTALVTTLHIRGLLSRSQYDALLPAPFVLGARTTQPMRTPKLINSVRKFAGKVAFSIVNAGISSGALKKIPAQYLLFGVVNKKHFHKYRQQIGP